MRARDLVVPFSTIRSDAPVSDTARLLAGQDLPTPLVTVVENDIMQGAVLLDALLSRMRAP